MRNFGICLSAKQRPWGSRFPHISSTCCTLIRNSRRGRNNRPLPRPLFRDSIAGMKAQVFLGIPAYNRQVYVGLVEALLRRSREHDVRLFFYCTSLLTRAFNELWC